MTFTTTLRNTYPQLLATVVGCFMAVSDGMTAGWSSPMIPYFSGNDSDPRFHMTKTQAEFMETVNILGNASGLPFVLILVDKVGRKKSVIIAAGLGALCWLALMFTPNKEILYVARYFAGMAGDMCFVSTPMYVAEIAEQNIRGFLSALIYIMMLAGIMIVYASGAYGPYWLSPLIGVILCGSEMLIFPLMPETPYFHIYHNDNLEEARKSLKTLRNNRDIDNELEDIRQAVVKEKAKKRNPIQALKELVTIPANRKGTIIMAVLNLAQHYSGITVLIMNVHPILEEAGSDLDSNVVAMIFSAVMITGALVSSSAVDKFGRKALLILSSVFTGTVLASLAIYFHLKYSGYDVSSITWLPAVSIMLYALAFKLGLGIVPIVITAEIFGASVKAVGMTVAEVFYITGAVTSVNVYSSLSSKFGSHIPLYLFMACAYFITFFTIFYIPETKGKTLDEIQLKLQNGKVKPVNQSAN